MDLSTGFFAQANHSFGGDDGTLNVSKVGVLLNGRIFTDERFAGDIAFFIFGVN